VTRLLVERRQQQGRNEQTNILIGLFFSAIGDRLLLHFFLADPNHSEIGTDILKPDQTEKDYLSLRERFRHHSWELDRGKIDLNYLKGLLTGKQDMLTRMLESPNLLEREQPTELLRATFHMMEELSARPRLDDLPNSDVVHLLFDSARVYRLAAGQWLERVQYLKINYPYLFSLVLRTNPFNENRSPIVR
jgi:hypothetical protein